MTLIGNLSYNSQALRNQSATLSVTGNNLANVNNKDYARQRLVNSSTAAEGAVGLERYSVEQVRDAVLDASVVAENGELGELEAKTKVLDQLRSLFSESIQGDESKTLKYSKDSENSGLTATFDSFYSAWGDLAKDPTSGTAKEVVYQTAQSVIDSLNALSGELDDLESSVSDYIGDDVKSINDITSKIASLNDEIVRAEMNGSSTAADLRNQRQALLEELGGVINVDYKEEADGSVSVSTSGADGNPFGLVSGDDANTLSLEASGLVGSWDATRVVSASGGSLAGHIASLGSIDGARAQLDTLVAGFVGSVNTAYASDGNTGLFFDAAGTTAGSINLDASIASSSDILSDFNEEFGNNIAKAVSVLSNGGSSVQDGFIKLSTSMAANYADSEDLLEGQKLVSDMLSAQRSSVSGVNLNEEVTNMMVQQRAFQASSRVINVLDQLLSTVVNDLV